MDRSDPPGGATAARAPAIAVGLAAAVLAAAILRLPFLGHQSLWLDEAFTHAVVAHGSLAGVWRSIRQTESTPPLFYVLTWAWVHGLGSDSAAMLRAPAAIAGVLCVPAVFLALRRLTGDAIALVVAWLAATSPLLVHYALDARAYSLLVLTATLSVWALAAVLETPSRPRLALWALAAAALLWTHYFGGYVALGELAVLAWRLPGRRRALAGWTAAAALAALPLAPLFLHQRGDARAGFIAQSSLLTRVEYSVRELAMGPGVPSAVLEGAGLTLALGGLVAGAWLVRRNRRRKGLTALGAVAAVAVGLPLVLALAGIDDHVFTRNLLGVWVFLAAIAAIGLTRVRALPLALYAALGVTTVLAIQADWRYQNVDWRGAAKRLGAAARDEPIVVYGRQGGPVVALYLDRRRARSQPIAISFWMLVEPARSGTRALAPVRGVPPRGAPGPPFALAEAFTYHGVRALHFRAFGPVPLDPVRLASYSHTGPPTILAPAGAPRAATAAVF